MSKENILEGYHDRDGGELKEYTPVEGQQYPNPYVRDLYTKIRDQIPANNQRCHRLLVYFNEYGQSKAARGRAERFFKHAEIVKVLHRMENAIFAACRYIGDYSYNWRCSHCKVNFAKGDLFYLDEHCVFLGIHQRTHAECVFSKQYNKTVSTEMFIAWYQKETGRHLDYQFRYSSIRV